MNKLFGFIVLAVLMIAAVFPVSAQYDQDDIDQAACVHFEVTLDSSGQYISVFLYQDEFNALLNHNTQPDITIQVGEPGTTLEYNVIVAPQTLFAVILPSSPTITGAEAIELEDGQFFGFGFGNIIARSGDMDTECLGA